MLQYRTKSSEYNGIIVIITSETFHIKQATYYKKDLLSSIVTLRCQHFTVTNYFEIRPIFPKKKKILYRIYYKQARLIFRIKSGRISYILIICTVKETCNYLPNIIKSM